MHSENQSTFLRKVQSSEKPEEQLNEISSSEDESSDEEDVEENDEGSVEHGNAGV